MEASENPRSRTEGLVIRELGSEVLIYDLRDNRVFCLNETSAHVWRACDGTKTVSQLGQSLSETLGSPLSESENAVLLALEQLRKEALLVNGENINSKFRGLSRRQAIRVFGAAAVAIPIITTLVVPTAAQAATCLAPGATSAGTFPFGGGMDSNTCLAALIARCCSGLGTGGCNCINPPTPNTCVGSVTCT